jgi:hypothetical protein
VIKRAQQFYQARAPGFFLINTNFPVATPDIPPLNEFELDSQLGEWLDYSLTNAQIFWDAKQNINDDSIPSICPRFGIAEHSAWLGMEVILQQDTCLSVPLLESPEDLNKLVLSEQNKWFQYMKKGYDYLRSKQDGTFVLSHRGTMSPMDIANAIRGDEIFLDFILNPEFAHRLMNFLVKAIDWYYGFICSWADKVHEGHVFFFGNIWMGQNSMGHLSNDLAMLCSKEIYKEFGFPYESQLTKKFQSILYHVHNEKMHYFQKLIKLPGLALLEVSNDPNIPETLENLQSIFAQTDEINLMLSGSSDQVRNHIDELKERNVWLQVKCVDKLDAEDIVKFVRDRSKHNF